MPERKGGEELGLGAVGKREDAAEACGGREKTAGGRWVGSSTHPSENKIPQPSIHYQK